MSTVMCMSGVCICICLICMVRHASTGAYIYISLPKEKRPEVRFLCVSVSMSNVEHSSGCNQRYIVDPVFYGQDGIGDTGSRESRRGLINCPLAAAGAPAALDLLLLLGVRSPWTGTVGMECSSDGERARRASGLNILEASAEGKEERGIDGNAPVAWCGSSGSSGRYLAGVLELLVRDLNCT